MFNHKKRYFLSMAGVILLGFFALMAWPGVAPVHATNHGVRMNEIMAGANGNSKIQFIELEMSGHMQNLWGPQNSEPVGRAMLLFSDTADNQTGRFVFPSDPPSGPRKVLIATQEFADLPGAPQPDFIIPAEIMAISGKVCFKGNEDNPGHIHITLCLSYGNFTGNTEDSSGSPVADTLPIVGATSLQRFQGSGFGFNNNAHFQLDTPNPTNSQGDTFTFTEASEIEQGRTLFLQETFNGNGRTCGSCHLPQEHFGLTSEGVASFPANDSLFLGEMNLNTLVLTDDAQPSDLRGLITATNGITATVFAGKAERSYLVNGGQGMSGTVTDGNGNSGTLTSFTAGDLDGLENTTLLGGERALILEHINGFGFSPFMRGSPHLLNLNLTAPFGLSGEFPDLFFFAEGAVKQHAPRSLNRQDGVDFRLPRASELAAMDSFMRSIRYPDDFANDEDNFNLDRFATTEGQKRGRELFFNEAKCSKCHNGLVLADADGSLTGTTAGENANFDTGVVNLPQNNDIPIDMMPDGSPRKFNTPPLFGVKETAPFFHDNSVPTLLEAVLFYDSQQFVNSPAGQEVGPILALLEPQKINDLVAFLESLVDLPFEFTSAVDFGTQDVDDGPTATQAITITNTETSPLAITNVVLNGDGAEHFEISSTPPSSTFAQGDTRTIEVAFDPTGAGAKHATLEITVSSANESWHVGVALSGNALGDGIRGDCNANGAVNAADLSAIVLEIFDDDGDLPQNVLVAIPFAGNPIGCNANGNDKINAGDLSCTVSRIFDENAACVQ